MSAFELSLKLVLVVAVSDLFYCGQIGKQSATIELRMMIKQGLSTNINNICCSAGVKLDNTIMVAKQYACILRSVYRVPIDINVPKL